MIHSKSIKSRMLTATVFNVMRAMVTFGTGILLARGLSPSGYGDLMFLLGSFMSIMMLLDMGSSNAFKTFASKAMQNKHFYIYYAFWLGIQFLVALAFVWLICPDVWLEKIWLGHSQPMILLALMAVFMQQKAWQMVGVIGEASRQTGRVQILNISVALFYLGIVVSLWAAGAFSVKNIFIVLSVQYAIALVAAYYYLKKEHVFSEETLPLSSLAKEYWKYCKPLLFLSFVMFLYDFTDKWLLQYYGGAVQQGYFQISAQFAAVALLATTSILNVFWKEIAEAWEQKELVRVEYLYRKVSRGLVMVSAVVAGFLVPWSEQIVFILLGVEYIEAWPVLALMFLYPIYQSLGQVGGAMLLATGHTKRFMYVSSASMLCSIPVTFYILAPSTGEWMQGLGLGAEGLALKIVLLSIVTVNLQAWVITRYTGWAFDWKYQVVGITIVLILGSLAKVLIGLVIDVNSLQLLDVILPMMLVGLLYLWFVAILIWNLPWLIGMNQEEVQENIQLIKKIYCD